MARTRSAPLEALYIRLDRDTIAGVRRELDAIAKQQDWAMEVSLL